MKVPSYAELPVRKSAPPGSSWGVFGDDDQLGTLNFITPERRAAASRLVKNGKVFALDLPLLDERISIGWRTNPKHCILHVGHQEREDKTSGKDDPTCGFYDRDDYLDGVWLQGGTQWDGLTHIRHPEYGNYNGFSDDEIHGGPGTKLGVDQWAGDGIIGRGLLLDVYKHLADVGRPYDPLSNYGITPEDLDETAKAQGEEILPGDIIMLRTGWVAHFISMSTEDRQAFIQEGMKAPGLISEERTVAYLWDKQVAAVATDTLGVEHYPSLNPEIRWPLHKMWLPLIGMPLGENWMLDELAEDCAADRRYAVFLVSVPLNVRGGVGTPPNAVALK